MSAFPQEQSLDSSIALLREGYTFGARRFERHRSDAFETRLMLRTTRCVMGEEAARMFYHPGRFTRKRAMPPTVLMLLQDKGSVQLQDGADHRHRKHMFMSLMGPDRLQELGEAFDTLWEEQAAEWARHDQVVLHRAVQAVLCRAVCRWAGVPLSDEDARRRTHEFAAMIDGAGSIGPRNWMGLLLRARSERWMRGVVRDIRGGRIEPGEGTAAHTMAWHRDRDGALLDEEVVAVELINVLRPTVAVARYITFAALALHQHPARRAALSDGDDEYLHRFVQEVRRYYPFFPFIGGRVREPFSWRGQPFSEGQWVLLDLYSTNHDDRIWEHPDTFDPQRFRDWNGSAFNFIPQGGGDHEATHRCPGEWITIDLTQRALRQLTHGMSYRVPSQNLSVDLSRMPAIPVSRFVISDVEPR